MLLDNHDVLAWVAGQLLQPTAPASPIDPYPGSRRKPETDQDGSMGGAHLASSAVSSRFDLSKDALRGRRSKTDLAR